MLIAESLTHAPDTAEHRLGGGDFACQRRRHSAICARDVRDMFRVSHAQRPPALSMPKVRRDAHQVSPLSVPPRGATETFMMP